MTPSRCAPSTSAKTGPGVARVHRTNEQAKELGTEGQRLIEKVQDCFQKAAQSETKKINSPVTAGLEAFENFITWREATRRKLGRPVEQGEANAAIPKEMLAQVMEHGSELRCMRALSYFEAVRIVIKDYLARPTLPTRDKFLAMLARARHSVNQSWIALNEHDESMRLKPSNTSTGDKLLKALTFAITASESMSWHVIFGKSEIKQAIDAQNLQGRDGGTLKDALERFKAASEYGRQALEKIFDHAENCAPGTHSRDRFVGMPNLDEETKRLLFASDAISVNIDPISEHLLENPSSTALFSFDSSSTAEPEKFALHMHNAVKMSCAALAAFANELGTLAPPRRPAGDTLYDENVVKTKFIKKPSKRAGAASKGSPVASHPETTKQKSKVEQTEPQTPNRTAQEEIAKITREAKVLDTLIDRNMPEKVTEAVTVLKNLLDRTTQEDVSEAFLKDLSEALSATKELVKKVRHQPTPEEVSKETITVNNLIKVIDGFADIHQVLRRERYIKVCADLGRLRTDVEKEVGKVEQVEDIGRLGKLLKRAESAQEAGAKGTQTADLNALQEKLNGKVLNLHGKSRGWDEYIKSLELDAYKLFELPQTVEWEELRNTGQIDYVGPAVKLRGKDDKVDGELFEIELRAKPCSNGDIPKSVFVHIHLDEPADVIGLHNVACAHIKNSYGVNRGRNWELSQLNVVGEIKDVHRSNIRRSHPLLDFLLQSTNYSNDDTRRGSRSVRHVGTAADAIPKTKAKTKIKTKRH